MVELKRGTKIKWCGSESLFIRAGIIIKEIHAYSGRTPDNKYGIRIDSYMVAELGTGSIYDVEKKDITSVMVDGKWISYNYISSGCPRSSGRYPWEDCDAADSIKSFIDNTVKNYIDNDIKATCNLIKSSNKNWFEPKKVIFNDPATIVIWKDGTKTIVKRREGEPDDKEKAVM